MKNPIAAAVASAAALDEALNAVCALTNADDIRVRNYAMIRSQQTGRPLLEILGDIQIELISGRRFEDTKLGYAISYGGGMRMDRSNCPLRHENGNCLPAGGFCTAVNDPICEALHNAFDTGLRNRNFPICPAPGWVSVEERLPDHGKRVLAHVAGGIVTIVKLYKRDNSEALYWDDESETGIMFKSVTHWMPLPEPPKEA